MITLTNRGIKRVEQGHLGSRRIGLDTLVKVLHNEGPMSFDELNSTVHFEISTEGNYAPEFVTNLIQNELKRTGPYITEVKESVKVYPDVYENGLKNVE